jgi:hypothetical protein
MILHQRTAHRSARSARLWVGANPSASTPVHSAPNSRSHVRANVPASFRRERYWSIRCTLRAYQVCPASLVGGAGAQGTHRRNAALTRRPNQASSDASRSDSPRARRMRWVRQV